MTVQEASHLWFFESHNNAKRSRWLQSTLSELEEKIKGMLKLIEGDADTFAQRAEMYYKKRPELVNMIEDFYRSYRSLAELCDQLKLESVYRGISLKDWSFIDKPSSSSSLIFDSESEVDDPSEGEEEQAESKLKEVREYKNFNETFEVGMKRERSDLLTYSFDSEPSEVSYPELEETQVEFDKLDDSSERKSGTFMIKPTIGKMEGTEVKSRNAAVPSFEQSKYLYGEPNNGQDENHALAESPINKNSVNCVAKPMIEKVDSVNAADKCFAQFESLNPEPNEGQDEYNLLEISDRKRDYLSHPLADGVKSKLENISDKFSGLSFENREVLNYDREDENAALAESPNKKSGICVVKPMIEKVDSGNEADKFFAQFESLNHEPNEGQDEYNLLEISDRKRDYLSHPLADRVKSKLENISDKLSGVSFENREVLNYEREYVCYGSNLENTHEEKSDSDDAKKLMNEVERLKGENVGFKVELQMKDEEKREVIRQLSLSVDILKGENDYMKRFIRDSNNRSSLFGIRKLKGVFSKNLFGGNKFKFSAPLVAL